MGRLSLSSYAGVKQNLKNIPLFDPKSKSPPRSRLQAPHSHNTPAALYNTFLHYVWRSNNCS